MHLEGLDSGGGPMLVARSVVQVVKQQEWSNQDSGQVKSGQIKIVAKRIVGSVTNVLFLWTARAARVAQTVDGNGGQTSCKFSGQMSL